MHKPPLIIEAEDDVDAVALSRTTAVNVRCPGAAHTHAGADACVICDAERDGTVEVLVTHVERDALACAARGRPFDRWLAPRLVKLGLLVRAGGKLVPTAAGHALLASHYAEVC